LRREAGELPEGARRVLAGLAEYLGELTLVEFKSPSDTLRAGDFQTFLAYAWLYRAQTEPLLDPSRLHLLVLAPRLTKLYRDELRTLGVTPGQVENGVWSLQGGVAGHPTWLLETETLAGVSHPLLTLFSPTFLHQGLQTYELLHQAGYTELVVHLAQQVHQFQLQGQEFAMQHLGAEDELKQVLRAINASLSPQERLEGLPDEELLKRLSPEKRLEGLSPEERVKGLSPDELEEMARRLRENGTQPAQS
jgi:hypothetical protein